MGFITSKLPSFEEYILLVPKQLKQIQEDKGGKVLHWRLPKRQFDVICALRNSGEVLLAWIFSISKCFCWKLFTPCGDDPI